jgi:5,5'-dehydrodivanillate O-demethylase oxygenase subunit
MLTADQNKLLTEVGPKTPMGELLRRYWMPVAAAAELDDRPVKAIRLLGEDLVLFKDAEGSYGLLGRHCPHRGADLSLGVVEGCGLRCNYHGWLWSGEGRCLEQPFDDVIRAEARFKDRVRAKAYPVESKAGVLWAYLGPTPAPLIPDWDRFHDPGYKQVVYAYTSCNWFQCQENSIDPLHFEWLHARWSRALKQIGPVAKSHLKLRFDEFEHGFVYGRIWEGESEADEAWTVGRVCLWPNALYTGMFEWRVPIDDQNTFHLGWALSPLPPDTEFRQSRIPYWTTPTTDSAGAYVTTHSMNQDLAVWTGMGTVVNRTAEHLGEGDRGIIMMRKRMFEQLKVVAEGRDPKGTIRDASMNHKIHLPRIGRENVARRPMPMSHVAGRPPEITNQIEELWATYRRKQAARDTP